jgi:SAM-dependent methyltransferase
MRQADRNIETYNDRSVVEFYDAASGLLGSEAYAFEKYIRRGDAVLDLGVGGGRTTPWLSAMASHYVGVDYAQSMVAVCKRKFPDLEFLHADACDLGAFADGSFDAVVFSFNGIDYISCDEARARCLAETRRVLRPGGRLIFSSHNAKRIAAWPNFDGADAVRVVWRVARAIGLSGAIALRHARTQAFREGCGYVLDPDHGGLETFVSTPAVIAVELERAGLRLAETINGWHPRSVPRYFTSCYHYIAERPQAGA